MTIKAVELAENTKRIARLLSAKMPHLEFAVWDLSDFMHAFHNVRRNMIFIECEEAARGEVVSRLAEEPKLRGYLVYSGERKPKAVNEAWASAKSTMETRDLIVVVSRNDFTETTVFEGNAKVPSRERRLVDLASYALRGYLPISLEEAVDALVWFIKEGSLRITALQRYATRRYLGWFLDILLYRLAEEGKISGENIDPRYVENGRRYYKAIMRVDEG